MTKHRLAIIGLGMAVAPHARSLLDLADRVEIVAAFSRSAERTARFAEQFAFPTTTDLSAVIDDPTITAALVLTPPWTHLDLVTRLAEKGKHILLEKPVEATLARATELVSACRRTGIGLGIVLQHRFREASMALAERIAARALGQVVSASVAVRWWRPQSYYDEPGRGTLARDGGGVLLTQAIHTLDLFQSLAGPIIEVAAFATTTPLHRMETEDTVAAALRFANGAIGALDATTASYPGFPERIEIVGERATAVLAAGGLSIFYQDGRREDVGSIEATGGGADPMAFSHEAHRACISDFLDAIEEGRAPRASGAAALAVHRLIDALLCSARDGRPVAVER
ncbi:MAG: Gfo/Idh/MocA family oxidoreductase [Alphaproteobacteria bacterium]|nr:Gfo/Idh/MocA family oxidoreductase [Alphaproteobacteria bacterium]